MIITGIHYFPLILFLLFPFTFLGTYIAAVLQDHVAPDFPYISDVATYSPESCVFGQLINMGAVLLCIVVFIRYFEVAHYYENYPLSPKISRLNRLGVWFGCIASLGLSIVANFQETNVKYVHYCGALLCYGSGTSYFWIQAICSYHMHPIVNSHFTAHFRTGLSMVCTVFFFVAAVAGFFSHLKYHGENPRKWYPHDGGWELHVVSTASEWVVSICFCLFILTFYSEFRVLSFTHPEVQLLQTPSVLVNEPES